MMLIADHPYLACAIALLFGLLAGWLAGTLYRLERDELDDDEITGIGA
jgi:hypothetical protein